ncbi:hypothetical protein COV18_06405 [Candidatus Woesearchaeota archaeon CG10_big_fil_rev_8_21_14_0_10_37_12]|nr:MAG: hypothetical protein COV18_06405 [Candidatus Woesearchaeota archaeon CG10_big_fil_rev_8_21_14_0_10_37_12]
MRGLLASATIGSLVAIASCYMLPGEEKTAPNTRKTSITDVENSEGGKISGDFKIIEIKPGSNNGKTIKIQTQYTNNEDAETIVNNLWEKIKADQPGWKTTDADYAEFWRRIAYESTQTLDGVTIKGAKNYRREYLEGRLADMYGLPQERTRLPSGILSKRRQLEALGRQEQETIHLEIDRLRAERTSYQMKREQIENEYKREVRAEEQKQGQQKHSGN